MTRNAMAADQARKDSQIGQAAILGTMAALDGVGIVLDAASLVCDFVPGPGWGVSVALDVANAAISAVSLGLGFLLDVVVDKEEVHKDAFYAYLDSPEFNGYLDNLADDFRAGGYDSLHVIIDTDSTVGDYGTGRNLQVTKFRTLTSKGKHYPGAEDLRLAILDQSVSGNVLAWT